MEEVRGAVEESAEAVSGFGFALGGVRQGPIRFLLLLQSGDDHGDGVVEFAKHFGFACAASFREFQIAITNVAGLGDLRADVIVEVTGEVEQKVAGAVAVGVGIAPKLLVRKGINPSVNILGPSAEFAGEAAGDGLRQSRHKFTFQWAAAAFSFL